MPLKAVAMVTTSVRYRIEHASRYRYAAAARDCVMALCLRPSEAAGQRLLRFDVETAPPSPVNAELDCFGNERHILNVHREHRSIDIFARSEVEVASPPPVPEHLGEGAWQALRDGVDRFQDWDFTEPSALTQPSSALHRLVNELELGPNEDPLSAARTLCHALHDAFEYVPGSTSAESSIEDILTNRAGVCQDYAHVMIAVARSWGIPTRYVSGYLHVPAEGGGPAPGNATHAWVECRLPELGWVGFDPTNRELASNRHIRIAVGRDYRDVAPVKGVRRATANTVPPAGEQREGMPPAADELTVDVSVRKVG